jgi:hypothetical protein
MYYSSSNQGASRVRIETDASGAKSRKLAKFNEAIK